MAHEIDGGAAQRGTPSEVGAYGAYAAGAVRLPVHPPGTLRHQQHMLLLAPF